MMRIAAFLVLLFSFAGARADVDLSGAWVAWICPSGVQQDLGRCSNFVLELHQKGEHLCGAHVYATAGAGRMDEGAAPSVTGKVADGVVTMTVTSGRAPVRIPVEMKIARGALQWQRLESPNGDYLLPLSTRLTRAKSKTLFAPLFEQELRTACNMRFTAEAEAEARTKAEQAAAAATAAPAAASPASSTPPASSSGQSQ
jgi:hypothetical protein